MRKKIVSGLLATAAVGTMFTVGATPALAAIKGNCTGITCLAADVYPGAGSDTKHKYVQDATVSITDGIPRKLTVFIAGDSWTSPGKVKSYKVNVKKYYPNGTLVCGKFAGSTGPACFPLK
jgi:hypothetical protein